MSRLRLIHWHAHEGRERAARLRDLGHTVLFQVPRDGAHLATFARKPPDAFVIDLGRLPSQGRDAACALREQARCRTVPLLFVGGAPEKVERVRSTLPDATFCTWRGIASALQRALASPVADPVVPGRLAGYSGTPLPKKVGIKPDSRLMLLGAPPDFTATLGALPAGVTTTRQARGTADVILLFSTRGAAFRKRLPAAVRALADGGRLWLAWPKKTSGVASDLTQTIIRSEGLATGLVDFKICAIDETWSGLCFTRRRA